MRMIDKFRRMMFPSGSTLVVTFVDDGGASETNASGLVSSGVSKARKRLNGERILYSTGGCGWGGDVGDS
jgi:hypothetical protein